MLSPTHAGAFCRAHLQDAWKFYSWGQAATQLARLYEQAFAPGAYRPVLGVLPTYMPFSELEYTAWGEPKLHEYFNLAV